MGASWSVLLVNCILSFLCNVFYFLTHQNCGLNVEIQAERNIEDDNVEGRGGEEPDAEVDKAEGREGGECPVEADKAQEREGREDIVDCDKHEEKEGAPGVTVEVAEETEGTRRVGFDDAGTSAGIDGVVGPTVLLVGDEVPEKFCVVPRAPEQSVGNLAFLADTTKFPSETVSIDSEEEQPRLSQDMSNQAPLDDDITGLDHLTLSEDVYEQPQEVYSETEGKRTALFLFFPGGEMDRVCFII